jgi:hypothetical protein
VLRRAGEGKEEGRFSFEGFANNWARLSSRSKDLLYGEPGTDVRDGLERLSKALVGRAEAFVHRHPFVTGAAGVGLIGEALTGATMHVLGIPAAAAGAVAAPLLVQALVSPGIARGAAALIERIIPPVATGTGEVARSVAAEPPKRKAPQDKAASRVLNDLGVGSPEGIAATLGLGP